MSRPYQTKKPIIADNDDLYGASEDALASIAEAMEALRGYWELDHIFEELGHVYSELEEKYNEYENIAAEQWRKEEEGLTRDYWRMVL